MQRLIEFPLEGGGTVVLEVDEPEAPGIARAARPDEVAERAKETFEQAVGRVTPAAEVLIAHLRNLAASPEEITLEFGINLSAAAGAVVAKAGVEANFKVSLTWRPDGG